MIVSENRIKLKISLIFIPVAFFSYIFHEFGHWIIGEILGNNMALRLISVNPKYGDYIENTDFYVICGGVIFTVLLIIIFWFIIEKYKVIYAYPIVFFNFFFLASPLMTRFELQDLAKISAFFNVGKYTIALIVLIPLLLITWRASHDLKILPTAEQKRFAWYVNQKAVFKSTEWEDYR